MALLNRQLIKLSDRGVRNATAFGSLNLGSMVFIKKLTSDGSDDTLSFVDGTSYVVLYDTYKEYMFIFKDIHAETDATNFQFQGNAAAGSGYNETITSTNFRAVHNEGGTITALAYITGGDQAQGTGTAIINYNMGTDNDENLSGEFWLFNPSSTTFIKHFIDRTNNTEASGYSIDAHMAGYVNSTSDVDAIQFSASSGNLDAGTIKMYGIKDS